MAGYLAVGLPFLYYSMIRIPRSSSSTAAIPGLRRTLLCFFHLTPVQKSLRHASFACASLSHLGPSKRLHPHPPHVDLVATWSEVSAPIRSRVDWSGETGWHASEGPEACEIGLGCCAARPPARLHFPRGGRSVGGASGSPRVPLPPNRTSCTRRAAASRLSTSRTTS